MILVYSDSPVFDIEWISCIKFDTSFSICNNLEEYIKATNRVKIAFVDYRKHSVDYDDIIPCNIINTISSVSNCVFVFESELHEIYWDIWKKCPNKNIYWLLPGFVNNKKLINDNIIFWGDWFKTTTLVYKLKQRILIDIDPFSIKPHYFDALLGTTKIHRDFVFDSVNKNSLNDKVLMTYFGKTDFIYETDTNQVIDPTDTTRNVNYYGSFLKLSQIIPTSVYKQTAYSIVTETNYDNTFSFFTEKTIKPIIAKRLFIVFSGYKFMYNLRRLGFKTFHGIIDERYDLIIDDEARFNAAFEQVKYLCDQDQTVIYKKLNAIVEHNYNIAMNRNWTAWSANQIEYIINTFIS
jgi:hypothetical protein